MSSSSSTSPPEHDRLEEASSLSSSSSSMTATTTNLAEEDEETTALEKSGAVWKNDEQFFDATENTTSSSSSSLGSDPTVTMEGMEDTSSLAPQQVMTVLMTVDRSDDPQAEIKASQCKDRGNEALEKGHYLEAIQHYSDGLEYRPTHSILLSNRALAYIKVENYGLALQDADQAIAADPTYVKGYYRRASANVALNHFKEARKDFRTVCKIKPKDRDARAKLNEVEKALREEAFAKAIQADQTAPLSATYDPNKIDAATAYDGPHPTTDGLACADVELEAMLFEPGQLSRDFVLASMWRFREQKLVLKRYVARALLASRAYFSRLNSLYEIAVPTVPPAHDPTASPRLTVCGDTHGQFYDVLHIFEMNGWPDKTNPYLFNGDFVDRGSFSFEVIMTLLLWKLYDPECIYLTRGNHETKNMNRIYGFEGEIKAKFDDKIFQLFLEVFEWLPLAAVIGSKVFVTHGGLPVEPNVTLDDIRQIPRGMEPPERGLMSDLLWSDPQPFLGKAPSKRGVGFAFGPDITANFLTRNGLQLLVRSHEVKDEGYLVEHGGKTITVFSAPNYCDSMGNKGAFIHFGEDLQPKFTQFEAVPHPPIRPMAYAAGMSGLFA